MIRTRNIKRPNRCGAAFAGDVVIEAECGRCRNVGAMCAGSPRSGLLCGAAAAIAMSTRSRRMQGLWEARAGGARRQYPADSANSYVVTGRAVVAGVSSDFTSSFHAE